MILTLGTTIGVQRTMVFKNLTLDHVNRAQHVHNHASTKSLNAARVIRALGGEVMSLGFVGGDTGKFCRHDLEALGIHHDFVEVPSPTRICISLVDVAKRQTTELVEETAPVTADDVSALMQRFEHHLPQADVLVMAGTLAPGVPDELYARCVRLARSRGVKSIVDAKGEALKLAIAEKPTWIKPNKLEVEETVGRGISDEESLCDAVRELSAMGAEKVLVTRGPDRAIFHDGEKTLPIAIPRVDSVNPIGSGDSVAAGIAFATAQNRTAMQCALLGLACGMSNATTLYSGHVTSETVTEMLGKLSA